MIQAMGLDVAVSDDQWFADVAKISSLEELWLIEDMFHQLMRSNETAIRLENCEVSPGAKRKMEELPPNCNVHFSTHFSP